LASKPFSDLNYVHLRYCLTIFWDEEWIQTTFDQKAKGLQLPSSIFNTAVKRTKETQLEFYLSFSDLTTDLLSFEHYIMSLFLLLSPLFHQPLTSARSQYAKILQKENRDSSGLI
jgi:hypothetical protein